MICPHCQSLSPVFEAVDRICFTPVIENWKVDEMASQIPPFSLFTCLECEGRVKIDFRGQHVMKVVTTPIFDEVTTRIMEIARLPEKRDELIPESVVTALKTRNFRGINRLMTGRDALSAIIEQKP